MSRYGVQGDFLDGILSYAVGAFNGVSDGGSGDFDTSDDEKDIAARVFAHPFKNSTISGLRGLGLGVAGTYLNSAGFPDESGGRRLGSAEPKSPPAAVDRFRGAGRS